MPVLEAILGEMEVSVARGDAEAVVVRNNQINL
jgi:hypothetical protein